MHRIAFKTAVATASGAGVVGSIVAAVGSISVVYPLMTALAAGLIAYTVIQRRVQPRLGRIESTLDELRRLGGRVDEMQSTEGDELDVLLRRADQASTAVRKRIQTMSSAEDHRREFLGDVSHELKTPIFAIQGYAETLKAGAIEDAAVSRGFVEKIFQNAIRLDTLATNLADISRLESGALKIVRSEFDIARLFYDVRDALEVSARRRGIDLQIQVGPGATQTTADRELIRQVVANLVDNAIKYNNPDGWVKLSAEAVAPCTVRLSVRDNGIGMSEADRVRSTERFYRADRSRARDQGGTGLGLSIVKHILAAHETAIEIDSAVGIGSTFSFTLPLACSPERAAPPGTDDVA